MAQTRQVLTGTVTMSAGSASVNATLSTVLLDTSKAFMTFTLNTSDVSPAFGNIRGNILDASTLRFQRFTAASSPAITIRYYVVEFYSGVTVQRGTAILNNVTLLDVTLSTINVSKSFPLITFSSNQTNFGNRSFVTADITSSTNIQFQMAIAAAFDHHCDWQVIEYDNCNVQSGVAVIGSSTANHLVTISPVNLAKSFITALIRQGAGTATNIGQKMYRYELSSSTQIAFRRETSTLNASASWYVVEFTGSEQVIEIFPTFSSTDTTIDTTISAVNTNFSIPLVQGIFNRHGSTAITTSGDPSYSTFQTELTSSTNVRMTRPLSGSTANVIASVIQFPIPINLNSISIGTSSEFSSLTQVSSSTVFNSSGVSVGSGAENSLSNLILSSSGVSVGSGAENSLSNLILSSSGVSSGSGLTFVVLSSGQILNLLGISSGVGSENSLSKLIISSSGVSVGSGAENSLSNLILSSSGLSVGSGAENDILTPVLYLLLSGLSQGFSSTQNTSQLTIADILPIIGANVEAFVKEHPQISTEVSNKPLINIFWLK